jgi:hypothetical protein
VRSPSLIYRAWLNKTEQLALSNGKGSNYSLGRELGLRFDLFDQSRAARPGLCSGFPTPRLETGASVGSPVDLVSKWVAALWRFGP